MADAIGLVVFVAFLACVGGFIAWLLQREDREERRDAQESATARRSARWEVAEEGGRGTIATGGTGGVVRVFVRRVTPDGEEVDRLAVAEVPSNAPNWDERIIQARSMAATRAALLNSEP